MATVDLVGHSLGGAIAAHYALCHGARVHSLVLLEPAFTLARPPANMLFWAALVSLPGLPRGLRECALSALGGGAEVDLGDPLARMSFLGTEGFAAALPQPRVQSDAALRGLAMPVYVAVADHASLAGGAAIADRLATQRPDIAVEIWPDTTHSLPMDAGAALSRRLLRFWAELDPGTR